MRVGIRPDPILDPFTNSSSLYISYTSFLRGFINTQGLFNRTAPIPSNLTYADFMNAVVSTDFINDKNELSAFMANVLVSSKGLTHAKDNTTSIDDELTKMFFRRGFLGINRMDEYKEASMDLFQDQRFIEDPEIILQEDPINWKTSLWKWKKSVKNHGRSDDLYTNFPFVIKDLLGEKKCEDCFKVYSILKKEWDPKSKPYQNCQKLRDNKK